MFDVNKTSQEPDMKTFQFAEYPSHSSIAAGVTLLASAWFLVAAATMVSSPTDAQVARNATVKVVPIGVVTPMSLAQDAGAQPVVAAVPDAKFRIVVEARRQA